MKNKKIHHSSRVSHVVVTPCVYGGFWSGLDANRVTAGFLKIVEVSRNPSMCKSGGKYPNQLHANQNMNYQLINLFKITVVCSQQKLY